MRAIREGRRDWIPAGTAALVVLIGGIVELWLSVRFDVFPNRGSVVPVVVATAAAVGLTRRWPAAALAVVWLTFAFQLAAGVPVLLVEMAWAAVIFGTAHWGGTATKVAGALSIPVFGTMAVNSGVYVALLITTLFGGSWLAGLALRRYSDRATHSHAAQRTAEADAELAHQESVQAKQIARLREGQAQLARDVHDVVGHSLAVILAQAESAQFIADTDALRVSMAAIAKLARSSLQDVRQVLTSTEPPDAGPGELLTLVEGVRASGHEITFDEIGNARTLAPELATVAYRVLQEMLTNAMRHGSRATPVSVELHWTSEELRIATTNSRTPGDAAQTSADGRGLEGMRRRVEAVGGRLDIRPRGDQHTGEPNTPRFTVIARVPLRRLAP
ncbi:MULTISPECIES: sensor histidine kinase [unclassified Nocardia]|uniref:sensor histidine kinase n=1 Tax=unclassified Nocardia TaxID=2637762 RepID=UPI00278C0F2A|nr:MULTISPECIES: histidine kinase [unclassified Nocardia]